MPNQTEDNQRTPNMPFDLMDGASGMTGELAHAVNQQFKISADLNRPIEERLEAYEDIIDSEVGDTALVRARNIERQVGLRQIFLKFEGGNPSGTQKDRIAFAQAMDALRRGYDGITVATCGNYGAAIALAASFAGIKCRIFVPENYRTKRIKEMTDLNSEIVRVSGDYEKAVEVSSAVALQEELYDANPGGNNTTLQLQAYGQIAYEIYDELRDAPYAVALPVSNGTTLAGVYKGFLSLHRRGKTSRMPKIIAGSSFRKNPIIQALLQNLSTCQDLDPDQIRETSINEPLVNWHSIDGDYALDAVRATQGWAANASDKSMRLYAKMIREKEGLQVLPASTAGLSALLDQHLKTPLPGDRYVVVLTGRKS